MVIYICDLHSVKLELLLQMSSGVPPVWGHHVPTLQLSWQKHTVCLLRLS